MRGWAVFLALAAGVGTGLAGCGSASGPARNLLPQPVFRLDEPEGLPNTITIDLAEAQGYLFASAHINRRSAGLFLVDTGASITVVDTGVAGRLDLPVVGHGRASGVAGQQAFEWRGVETLSFADIVALPVGRVAALSMHQMLGGVGVSPGGVVGYGSFGTSPYTIDFPQRQLVLHRRDAFVPPAGATKLKVRRMGGVPVIEATLGAGEQRLVWLLIDTGAHNPLTLPAELRQRWPDVLAVPDHGPVQTRGVGGTVDGSGAWVSQLNALGVSLRDVPTNFEPAKGSFANAPVPVGRVGNRLLAEFVLTFDPPNGVVYVRHAPPQAGTVPRRP